MELIDLLTGYLEKTQNFPKTEFASLQNEDGSVKDDALDKLISIHAKSVTDKRDADKKQKDKEKQDEFKRGWKENNEIWDGNLKAIGVDLEGVQSGEEKFERLKAYASTLASKKADLTDDQVKNLPAYRKRETELNQQFAAEKAEWDKKWNERDAKEQRERTLSVVKDKAKVILDGLKPVLSSDPERARKQLGFFFSELEKNGYDVDGETIYVKDAEGKRVETDHGNAIRFEDYVKNTASQMYDFQVSDQKNSAGDVTKGTKVNGVGAGKKPANRKELADAYAALADNTSLKADEKARQMQELKALEPTLG